MIATKNEKKIEGENNGKQDPEDNVMTLFTLCQCILLTKLDKDLTSWSCLAQSSRWHQGGSEHITLNSPGGFLYST